jgi:UDP-N-acetylglucosamine diphosphorylase/glucosamine-1-phosphate N-acetyltransferase
MRICIFEDRRTGQLEPLNLTRPTFDLLCGWTTLFDKHVRHFPTTQTGVLIRPHLAELCRWQHPEIAVNEADWLRSARLVLVNSRWLPPPQPAGELPLPCVGMCSGEPAFVVIGPEQFAGFPDNDIDECLAGWQSSLPQVPAQGQMVHNLWDLVQCNADQICRDSEALPSWNPSDADPAWTVLGPRERARIDRTAAVEPHVVLDTRQGPVIVDRDAVVTAFSRLEGPCVVGPRTQILGARLRAGTTVGPNCRVGGEVEASILLGFDNKYHDGFLGHSYLGEWVNLGAGTSNSDLRNDYGEVTVIVAGQQVPTGLPKVGCFLGDHTKTGLGVVLNTGTSAGMFCNLLPSATYPAKRIPSFCNWWNGTLQDNADLSRLLTTADKVMRRRGQALTDVHAEVYRQLHQQSAAERRRAIRDREQARLKRSA